MKAKGSKTPEISEKYLTYSLRIYRNRMPILIAYTHLRHPQLRRVVIGEKRDKDQAASSPAILFLYNREREWVEISPILG
jgi:hypothetical protein